MAHAYSNVEIIPNAPFAVTESTARRRRTGRLFDTIEPQITTVATHAGVMLVVTGGPS